MKEDNKLSALHHNIPNPKNVFYRHLDECEQCRNHPFNLCVVGQRKIREAIYEFELNLNRRTSES